MTARVEKAITTGVTFLASTQAPDGSFATYISSGKSFQSARELRTTFAPALILGALAPVGNAGHIRNKVATWLLAQKNPDWSFNYWPARAEERTTRPYPNDLDDTCCAIIGLYRHDPTIVDSACLAKLVRLLLATEKIVGGPYKTWLVSKQAGAVWQDVDLAVNCNVAYLLRLIAKPLPNLDALMERTIATKQFASRYYPIPLVVTYFLARAYSGPNGQSLARYITAKQKNGHWQTPGQTALALSALHNLGDAEKTSDAVKYLLSQQQPDGSWPAEAFWLDEVQASGKQYAGSSALTTALVLEVLTNLNVASPRQKPAQESWQKGLQKVVHLAEQRLRQLGSPLRQHSLKALASVGKGGSAREIVLLPHIVADSLTQKVRVRQHFYATLGLANLFGWIAYTIYDDFLDGEGKPRLLPVANVAMRESLACFAQALPQHEQFAAEVHNAFARIDAANAWEVTHCRLASDERTVHVSVLPKYRRVVYLAERSIGHGLTPLAVLAATGLSLDDSRVQLFKKAFTHYLAARQLNDDLHDWQHDFRQGHVSYVVAFLLGELDVTPGRHSFGVLLPQMERHFWQHSLQALCKKVSDQIALSRRALAASGLFKPQNQFLGLLNELDQSMTRTLQEQQKALEFLRAYSKNTKRK